MAKYINGILSLLLCLLPVQASSGNPQKAYSGNNKQQISDLQAKVRQIYTSQLGIREKGTNSGLEVQKYLRYVNLPKANPWCAAFVCWVFGEANVKNPRSGWSPDLFPASRRVWNRVDSYRAENGKLLRAESGKLKGESRAESPIESGRVGLAVSRCAWPPLTGAGSGSCKRHKALHPQPADIFGLYFPEKKRIAHVGFVDEWKEPWVVTVEGNTNAAGSRDGDGVYRKRRLVRTMYQVARYVN
ncbi:MAG: hypothetical protein V4721_01435 [Bacteroidota bacterium]